MKYRSILFVHLFSILIIIPCYLYAATKASIEGNITDTTTGQALPGANVFLGSTSIGTATNIDGKYTLTNIPPGEYTLHIKYIGYQDVEIPVQLQTGESLIKNIELESMVIKGEAVEVTVQAEGQNAAINRQLSAKQIVNVVSSAQIQELPDANAAESIRRLPGVSLIRDGGEGTQIVIRGLSPKYNTVTIDGMRMASSNVNDRGTDLSMISSMMLESIEVSKTVTADQDADNIGGTVNFKIKEARSYETGHQFHLLAQGGYTGLSNTPNKYDNYKFAPSLAWRFFNNRLGVFAQANLERRNLSSNEFGASYTNHAADLIYYNTQSINMHYIPRDRKRTNAALVLDYKLPNGKIRLTNFGNSSKTERTDRYEVLNINAGGAQNQHLYTTAYTKSQLNMLHNSINVEGQLPLFHCDLKLSHDYSETKNPEDWAVNFLQTPAGINQFENKTNLNPQTVADSVFINAKKTKLSTVTVNNNTAMERSYTAALDLDFPLRISEQISSVIKFGGKYRWQKRSYASEVYGTNGSFTYASARGATLLIVDEFDIDTNEYIALSHFLDENFDYGNYLDGEYDMHNPVDFDEIEDLVYFCEDNVDEFAKASAKEAFARNNYLSITNNYSGKEHLSAAYIMATINIGSKLMVIPGIRYQNLKTTYSGTRGQQTALSYYYYDHSTDTTVMVNHPYWLPNLNIRYKPLNWFDVRLSYTNTLSYPDFNAIIPRIDVSTSANLAWNNYKLKSLKSKNYDVYFSFSDNMIGLFTVGGFLKKIDNLIYAWRFGKAGLEAKPYYLTNKNPAEQINYKINTFINNPFVVTNWGLEFEWQTHFWYLPNPLKGLIFNINYTHVSSEAEYPYVIAGATSLTNIDTSFTDRLIHQPNHILNLTIGYDFKGFSIRASMLYQDDVFTGISQWPQLRTNTAAYRRWDISAKQNLPWFGLQLFGNVNNLNNAEDEVVLQMYQNIPQSIEMYGMTAELGLRLEL